MGTGKETGKQDFAEQEGENLSVGLCGGSGLRRCVVPVFYGTGEYSSDLCVPQPYGTVLPGMRGRAGVLFDPARTIPGGILL